MLIFFPILPSDENSPAVPVSSEKASPLYVWSETTVQSPSIYAGEDTACGKNVKLAINASSGALRYVELLPGSSWSFNRTMGNPALIPYVDAFGVPGGCWCNLAARFAYAFEKLGAGNADFIDHGLGDLGAGPTYSVAIWNTNGGPGEQDLRLYNSSSYTVRLEIVALSYEQVAVEAKYLP